MVERAFLALSLALFCSCGSGFLIDDDDSPPEPINGENNGNGENGANGGENGGNGGENGGNGGENGGNGGSPDPCDLVTCASGEECEVHHGTAVCVPGVAPDCFGDSDCQETEECVNGDCLLRCRDASCQAGWFCEPTTGECVEEEWTGLTGTLWYPPMEWSIHYPEHSGNPFDVAAWVTFTHHESGETRRTQMFYDENGLWKFRFAGTQLGLWSLESSSEHPALHGESGTFKILPNPDPNARGFLTAVGDKLAVPVGNEGRIKPFLFHLYQNSIQYVTHGIYGPQLADWQGDPRGMAQGFCAEAQQYGFPVIWIHPHVQFFKLGVVDSRQLPSGTDSPDPATFRIIEEILFAAYEAGCHLHIWMWGDEDRFWTPIRVGGINGVPDRRLQRYIAARLGPVAGWSLGYGFDLFEWVNPAQVSSWADYLNEHWGWKHLVEARHEGSFATPANMDIFSTDERVRSDFYNNAVQRLQQSGGRPPFYTRRFMHTRDGVWDMDTTRRALWQFTMAGAVAAWWGTGVSNCTGSYPRPDQLLTFRTFFDRRFTLDMQRANHFSNDAVVLRTGDGRMVLYRENTGTIHVDLSSYAEAQPVIAVDARGGYQERDLGTLSPGNHVIHLPHGSDWAIAIGSF